MWAFINNNAQGLSVIASFGTMLIWLFYAHLLLQGFRRQRQPQILINQGWGEGSHAVALVCNMSHEPIYVLCVIASLHLKDGRKFRSSITDYDQHGSPSADNSPHEITRQGPLQSGAIMNVGTFHRLVGQAAVSHKLIAHNESPIADIGLETFRITVIGHYGPTAQIVGAQRSFSISGTAHVAIRPTEVHSRRFENRRERKKMERWLREHG